MSKRVSSWLCWLEQDAPVWRKVYGPDTQVVCDARTLLRDTLLRYREHYGDDMVQVYRAPGRINLRGMHVDTHGGLLNLMSHQREIVVVAGRAAGEGTLHFTNVDRAFADVCLNEADARAIAQGHRTWDAVMSDVEAEQLRASLRGCWSLYLWGVAVRAAVHLGERRIPGMRLAVGSNLPTGAALSSSASLCLSALLAITDAGGDELAGDKLILAARDAEWFTGARTGTCDQAAEVLGRPGTVAYGALLAEDFTTEGMRYYTFPEALDVLVVNTYTRRSLSGAQLAQYTANRFAYSMALHVLRAELAAMGLSPAMVVELDRLSRLIDSDRLEPERLVELLLRLPNAMDVASLRRRYAPPDLDAVYDRYFGNVPEAHRPTHFDLRGPLLFGVAESLRAQAFARALATGDGVRAGRLMTIGHDGDRVLDADGHPYDRSLSAEDVTILSKNPSRLVEIPGDYGASSPVLDGVVDAALAAGALGASLTGAGIAGSVMVLVRGEDRERVSQAVRIWLASPDYGARSGRAPLSEQEIADAVVRNVSPAGAAKLPC